jgi:hypothetical protein
MLGRAVSGPGVVARGDAPVCASLAGMSWSFTEFMLIVIALLLVGMLYQLDKIRDAVETLRNIEWKRWFGD